MSISFEYFPPRNPEAAQRLRAVRSALRPVGASYSTVTCGAGGTSHEGTFPTVQTMLDEGLDAGCHLTCTGLNAAQLRSRLNTLKTLGCKRIVALRGDRPSGKALAHAYAHAQDLVRLIRAEHSDSFHITVAAYPEMHPESANPSLDQQHFAQKVQAGADSAITQYFFNADAYFRFVEAVAKLGVHVPIVPGIMPITNSVQLQRFSSACGAEIPRWMRVKMDELAHDPVALQDFGTEVVAALCQRLLRGGAPSLHVYTMNQSEAVLRLCRAAGLVQPEHAQERPAPQPGLATGLNTLNSTRRSSPAAR